MNQQYLDALQDAIQYTHGYDSCYVETESVREEFNGRTVWDGQVEVFELKEHPHAKQCYAWRFKDDAGKWQYVAVLRVAPINSPVKAVQAYIIS